MANLLTAYAPSRWRLICKTDAAAPLTAASYTVTRQDSGPGAPTVAQAFLPNAGDTTTVALIMSTALLDDVVYVATLGTGSIPVSFSSPTDTPATIKSDDDPEAEAFGVDWDWIDGDPDATGDIPRRRGLDCLDHDLPMRGRLSPGELVNAPEAGAGLDQEINGSGDPDKGDEIAARYEAECRQDPRVEQAVVEPTQTDDGELDLKTLIKPYALDDFHELDGESNG